MSDSNKVKALEIMLQAQGQIIETLLGVVLGQVSKSNSEAIKSDLQRNATKYVDGYKGAPIDAEKLQSDAAFIQDEILRILNRAETVESQVRDSGGKQS